MTDYKNAYPFSILSSYNLSIHINFIFLILKHLHLMNQSFLLKFITILIFEDNKLILLKKE